MGLTSRKVLVLAVAFAVLLFIGTVWLWPRLARRNWRAVSGRVGLLLATQLVLFASSASASTRPSVSTPAGPTCSARRPTRSGRRPLGAPEHRRPAPRGRHPAGERTGRFLTAAARGPGAAGRHSRPYDPHRHPRVRVPAAGVLPAAVPHALLPCDGRPHGVPGHRPGARRQAELPAHRAAVGQGRPDEADDPGDDAAHGGAAARHGVRGRPGRPADRVVLRQGPSRRRGEPLQGEQEARELGRHRRFHGWLLRPETRDAPPGTYVAGVGLSPYYKAPKDPTTGDLFQGDETLRNEADLSWYLKHRPAPDTSLLVTSSKVGEHNYKDTLKFIDQVQARNSTRISSIILDSGGHNFNTWRREIPPALQWISGRLTDWWK